MTYIPSSRGPADPRSLTPAASRGCDDTAGASGVAPAVHTELEEGPDDEGT